MQPSRREVVTLTEQKGGQIMSGGARTGLIIAVVAVLVVIAVFAFGLVDIDQTRETALPEVKTEGGQMQAFDVDTRSEERRGGKECISKFRSRWAPYHKNKKKVKKTGHNTER